jgi:hypothetical protein
MMLCNVEFECFPNSLGAVIRFASIDLDRR